MVSLHEKKVQKKKIKCSVAGKTSTSTNYASQCTQAASNACAYEACIDDI